MTVLTRGLIAAALIFSASSLACHASTTSPPARDAAADEAAVRAASAAWDEAHNAGDVMRLMDLYADSAVSMPFNRPALDGRAAIEADFRAFLAEATPHHRTEIVSVVVTGDWAIEHGRYQLTVTPKGTGAPTTEVGKHIVVRQRIGGAWKIRQEIWNTDAPPAGPGLSTAAQTP
jgi:uncharacterized protein (TIGR02246 family)